MRALRTPDPLAHPETLIPRVYAYAAYRLGHGPDAEDLTSEVFERALRYRKSYDGSKGEPVAWLLGIAHRCANDALAARTAVPLELTEAADGRSVEEESILRVALEAALAQLSERDRELIALRYGADLTAGQIAEVMDAQTNAIEVALHRALRRLRAILDDASRSEPTPRASEAGAR
jgi:RNA polymerase sigma factor (sigma-70 family)